MGNKSAVSTPLILLQQLSRSLTKHFEEACEQALEQTRRVLAKLEKQRGKIEQRLREARVALDAATLAGKPKAQARAHEKIDALQCSLDEVLDRQVQTHTYLLQLQRDVQTSLELAQGIGRVGEAAARALDVATGSTRASTAAAPPAKSGIAVAKVAAEALPRRTAGAAAKAAAGRSTNKPAAP